MKKDVKEITMKLEVGVKESFENGRYAEYLQFISKFHQYSFNNVALILMQKPDATMVAGYNAWKKNFGRYVRKGETGITILAPCKRTAKKIVTDENGNEHEEEFDYMRFKTVSVFDVKQTEGEEVPTICDELKGKVKNYKQLVEKLKSISPVPISYEKIDNGAHGYYHLKEKRIAIKKGMSQKQTVKTMLHEISHAMLHDKDNGTETETDSRTSEVQAESIAYTVSTMLGIDTSDYSFDYVASWSKDKSMKELTKSMDTIRKTATKIYDALKVA